jgi:glutaredoxin
VLKDMNRRASGYVYDKLVAPRRTSHPVAQHLRNLASIANELLGRPLRPAHEAPGEAPGDASGAPAAGAAKSAAAAAAPTPVRAPVTRGAPVLVYFDGKDHRTLARVEELLRGRGYAYQVLDVSADEAEHSWVTTTAKTSELPLVFIAGAPVGGFDALLQADVSGELARLVSASA